MSHRTDWVLSEEDRVLWHQVASTAKALRPTQSRKAAMAQPVPATAAIPASAKRVAPAPYIPSKPTPAPARGQLDRQTVDKIAKGRLQLEARVDLHGMRQDEAYSLLLSFVSRAHQRGARYVLVITGKGPGGDGVLKRSVPAWLRTTPFQAYVSGLDHASRGHGGAGALYLRIKRHKAIP